MRGARNSREQTCSRLALTVGARGTGAKFGPGWVMTYVVHSAGVRDGAAACGPWINREFVLAAFLLGLFLGPPAPGDLGIGENDGRDRQPIESDGLAGEHFGGDAAFVCRLVRQHWLTRHIADRQNV